MANALSQRKLPPDHKKDVASCMSDDTNARRTPTSWTVKAPILKPMNNVESDTSDCQKTL